MTGTLQNGVDASFGSLTVGYGCGGPVGNKGNVIGPEYGFGFGMHSALAPKREKILIIKVAASCQDALIASS